MGKGYLSDEKPFLRGKKAVGKTMAFYIIFSKEPDDNFEYT